VFLYIQLTKIDLGFFNIQIWGLFVALGILTFTLVLWKRSKGLKTDFAGLLDLSLYMIISGFIFARLFHIIFYELGFYYTHLIEIFKVWNGGLSSFGGFFGAGVGFYWYVRRKTELKNKIWILLDQLSFAALFGWIIGRLGCASIHDHLGRISNSFLAVNFPGTARLDMAIMEILFLIPLAVLFFILRKKSLFTGFYFCTVLIYYGSLRFVLDFFRATDIIQPDVRYLGLTPGQYSGIVLVVLGFILFRKKKK